MGAEKITYISIQSEGDYWDTGEQIRIRDRVFSDRGISKNEFASRRRTRKLNSPTNVEVYATSSNLPDTSGNLRSILSTGINPFASSSVISYRTGVEMMKEEDWVKGTVKISGGNPGHLIDRTWFGVSENYLISPNVFTELDNFSPVHFVYVGGDSAFITYPIVIGDENLDDMNGIVEPFTLRGVLTGKSTYFPHEPHGIRGSYGDGNINKLGGTESVVSIYSPTEFTPVPFLDDSQPITLDDEGESVRLGTVGYVNNTLKLLTPFNEIELSGHSQFSEIELSGNPTGTTYIREGEVTSPVGWDWEGSIRGTDSIAFGGRGNTRGSKRLGSRKLLNERDSCSFLSECGTFNDTNTLIFDEIKIYNRTTNPHRWDISPTPTYTIQYPEMLPVGYVYSPVSGSGLPRTLVNNVGGIKILRGTKPNLIVWNLTQESN